MLRNADIADLPRLYSYLDTAYNPRSTERPSVPALHAFSLAITPQMTIPDLLRHARSIGLQADMLTQSKDLYRVSLGVRQARESGYLLRLDDYWLFLSNSSTAQVESTVRGFTHHLYPLLKQTFLPSESLLDLLNHFAKSFQDVIVTEGTIWMQGQTTRSWKKAPHSFVRSELQREASRDKGKWTGISVRLVVDDLTSIHCRLHERGHLTLYSGPFTEFRGKVLLPYLSASDSLSKRLRGKERRDLATGPKLNAIPLSLPHSLTLNLMGQLRNELVSKYSAAVIHPGNPLLLLQLVDRADGSAFDLYAFGQSVRIVPRQKASAESVTELVSAISDVLPSATLSLGTA
jgi:hypothetical protein